jgi:hypothetical protein
MKVELYRAQTKAFLEKWCGEDGLGMKTAFFPGDADELKKFLKDAEAHLLMAKEGAIQETGPTELTGSESRSYVRDFSAEMSSKGKAIFSPVKGVMQWGFRLRIAEGGRIQGPFFLADVDLTGCIVPKKPVTVLSKGGYIGLPKLTGLTLNGKFAIPVNGAVLCGATEDDPKTLLLVLIRCAGALPEVTGKTKAAVSYTLAGWMLPLSKSEVSSVFRKDGPRPRIKPETAGPLRIRKRHAFTFTGAADSIGFKVSAVTQASYIMEYDEDSIGSRRIRMPLIGNLIEKFIWEDKEQKSNGKNAVIASLKRLRRPFVYRKAKEGKEKVLWPVYFEMAVEEDLDLPDAAAAAKHETRCGEENALLPLLDRHRKHRGALLRTVKVWVHESRD